MKKFLHWNLKKSVPEIPAALDQQILAAAAMRANGFKHRRRLLRIVLPGITGAAAAAAAAAAFVITGVIHQEEIPRTPRIPVPFVTETISEPENNVLALYDMTALEQGNYTIALASETVLDEDLLSI